jgi:hypothetical protein
MSRFTTTCLCLFAATAALAAPACDPADGDAEAVQPRLTPPKNLNPQDISAYPSDCGCSQLDAPVCGVDGESYPNDCEAGCIGVDVEHDGPCSDVGCEGDADCGPMEFCDQDMTCGGLGTCSLRPDVCDLKLAPVCGCDGEDYESPCMAHAAGVSVAAVGECGCVCPLNYSPVCGVDGKTYGNACAAGCADVDIAHAGECAAGCTENDLCATGQYCERDLACGDAGTCQDLPQACTFEYAPVCGCDSKTYSNECTAHAAGVSVASQGECEGMELE